MKKLIALLLVLSLAACLFVGCAGEEKPTEPGNDPSATPSGDTSEPSKTEKDPPVFYYVGPRTGGLAWNQSKEGFEAAIKELGIEGYFIAPQTPFNNSEVLELTNTAITNGADIVMGAYSDPSIFKSICDEMRAKGIVTACLGNYSDCVDVQVAPTYEVMGDRFCAELEALAKPDEQLNILLIGTNAGVKTDAFVASINAFCDKRGNAKLVDTEFAQGDAIAGADVTASTLRAYPEINCIICYDATSGLGVGTYVMENDLDDDLYVLVEANSGDCINAVLNGGIDKLVNWEYYDMGYQATMNAVAYYYGEDVETVSAPEPSVITKDNAKEYAERFGIELIG